MEVIIKKTIAWLSLLVIVLYIITGFGMTKTETVTKLTFGLLDRSLSHTIHVSMEIPLVILLLAHIFFACGGMRFFKRHEEEIVCKPEKVVKKK